MSSMLLFQSPITLSSCHEGLGVWELSDRRHGIWPRRLLSEQRSYKGRCLMWRWGSWTLWREGLDEKDRISPPEELNPLRVSL